ncbi:ATP-dependent DNA helicase [Thecamonas trahens ATCC 50062]|uniref:ATP-dependent DNA helicase n=1 Tax=Thecamonas trahens ATCC 50062 TaxID=461836 RepID=A0A0L0DA15_THETB|nr:ATP-dependent DNA helicase [Thecamonas trahens ATCC 50062]KNC48128.1 ATP-dependent DNA helicase [Thecamonas trahens ATCC 50062]|eukprot:XP_013758699.1 ATP-dependent DNA helicase [Thecamonas trahens ATCC 50062]
MEASKGLDAPRPIMDGYSVVDLAERGGLAGHELSAVAKAVARAADAAEGSRDPVPVEVLHAVARSVFGHAGGLRATQVEAIAALMEGKHTFASLPTGGGKSLIYQMAAALMPGLTLVVSPLLALISEQATRTNSFGIPSTFITSATSRDTRAWIEGSLAMASQPYQLPCKMLFVTPERVALDSFQSLVADLSASGLLSLFAIDEAHCMSEWGHDFRPHYAELGVLHDIAPEIPVLAASGTAPPRVRRDVGSMLLGDASKFHLVAESFDRPNLTYVVRPKESDVEDDIAALIATSFAAESGIVYCLTTRDAERVTERLAESGIAAAHYHGGMSLADRAKAQEAWSSGETPVLCTTVAFGLGIDKLDVRFVIHHSLPMSLEGYYQQSGRAGRDGKSATCVLFYKPQDLVRAEKVQSSTVVEHPAVDESPDAPPILHRNREFQIKDQLDDIKQFCLATSCRRAHVLNHFGEFDPPRVQASPCCDVCSPQLAPTPRAEPPPKPRAGRRTTSGSRRARPRRRASPALITPDDLGSSGVRGPASIPHALRVLDSARQAIATRRGIKPAHVFSKAALLDLARRQPSTMDELQAMASIPNKKAALYGEEIIEVLSRL